MDVFGGFEKPGIEIIDDFYEATPVHVSGFQDTEFYDQLGVEDADLVLVRDYDAIEDETREMLDTGLTEICSRAGDYSLYIGDVPGDFPGMNPYEVDSILFDHSLEQLVEEYGGRGA